MKQVIKLTLKNLDESYDTQSKIVATLLKSTNLLRRNVIDVDESSISIEITPNTSLARGIKNTILKNYSDLMDLNQCSFCDGGGADGTVGDVTPSGGTDAPQGFGNANLRGTTILSGPEKGKKMVNVDKIIHDQTQYTKEACPQIQYCDGESVIILPASQEQYSVGSLTPRVVAQLNQKFQDMWADILASDLDSNAGNPTTVERQVQVDVLRPKHQTTEGLINSNKDKDLYITKENDGRSEDARNPERVPVAGMLMSELSDIIKKGHRTDTRVLPPFVQSTGPSLPKLQNTELPTQKSELVQRLLAFSAVDDLFENVFSLTTRVATGFVAKGVTQAAMNRIGADPNTANKAGNAVGVAAGMNQNKIINTVKKPFK